MDAREQSEALHARVRRFIAGSTEESFDGLACDIARFQARSVAPVGKLFSGIDLAKLSRADDIVALPTDAFRLRRIAAHPPEDDERCFVTSGTTAELRGRHPMRTTETYRLAALAWARVHLLADVRSMVALVASERTAPASSLSFMLARFAETIGDASWCCEGQLDIEGAVAACRRAREPLLLAGTSFAFVHLLDALDGPVPLPRGSRIMHTGGFKGRSREVEPGALRSAIADAFDIDSRSVIGEYGMTELSSQVYQGESGYLAPPWLRVTAVDPETLSPTAGTGLARFADLANVDSVVAVQTADVVRVLEDGSVELMGRAPGATPRGCSLVLEDLDRLEDR